MTTARSPISRRPACKTTFIRLDEVGIRGNGHMMMLEKNNMAIAGVMADWLDRIRDGTRPQRVAGAMSTPETYNNTQDDPIWHGASRGLDTLSLRSGERVALRSEGRVRGVAQISVGW